MILVSTGALAQTRSSSSDSGTASHATTDFKWPAKDGTISLTNFKFGDGNSLASLRLHYLTLGKPHRNAAGHTDNAVLLLHGTGGDAKSLLNPAFSNVLFGPGALLDINRYFLILPDDIGHVELKTFRWFARTVSRL
jgi:homoserine O-acetyltransferase